MTPEKPWVRTFSSSVPGPYHIKSDLPNQDRVSFRIFDDWIFAAISDGAGSLAHSDLGAEYATTAALDYMESLFQEMSPEDCLGNAIEAAIERLKQIEDFREYGATLALVAMSKDGEWFATTVGDSFSVIHLNDGSHILNTGHKPGEYANLTQLLTSVGVIYEITRGTDALGFSLSTDGLERVATSGKEPHNGFWSGIVSLAKNDTLDISRIFEWLNSLDKIEDDTTLLTAVLG